MAKKKKEQPIRKIKVVKLPPREIVDRSEGYVKFKDTDGQLAVNIFEFNKAMMCIYGANVNLARSLPHVFDGLKNVERRILWSMFFDEKMRPYTKNKKVAKIVGTCLGNYYPHGDIALVDALCRMAQDWVYDPTLIRGQGNYGSESGDGHAAMRYIEAGMADITYDAYFSEWFPDITDYIPNFDGTSREPVSFPSKYPMLLIKGTSGIGYALYGGIPPFNINELMDLTCELVDNPNKKNVWLYPDFPNACQIVDNDFKSICEEGVGKFKTRANIAIKKDKYDNDILVITSLPYTILASSIKDTIKDLRKEKKLDGILYLKDNTGDQIEIVIGIKKGFNPEIIRDRIYKSTRLEHTYTVSMLVVYDYKNIPMNLKGLILNWIELRRDVKRRIYAHRYSDLCKKYHLSDSIIQAIDDITPEKLLKIMRTSRNKKAIMELLIDKYNLTDIQSEKIANMHMHELSKDSIQAFRDENKKLKTEIDEIEHKLDDDELIDKEIKQELRECKKKYGKPRRSEIITRLEDVTEFSVIPDTNHVIVITEKGYIKKLAADTQGVGKVSKNDVPVQIIKANNYDTLHIFDEYGKCFALPVRELPEMGKDSSGVFLTNYIKLKDRVVSVLTRPKSEKDVEGYYVFITKDGMIKKTEISNYSGANLAGIVGMVLKNKDKLVDVIEAKKNKDIIIYTEEGMGVRYSLKEVNHTNRVSSGVKSISSNSKVIGCSLIDKKDDYIFVITDKGKGKKCVLNNFDAMGRLSKPLNIIHLEDSDKIAYIKCASNKDELSVVTSNDIRKLSMKDVPELTRKAKAKKIVPLIKGEIILKVSK